MGRKPRLSFEIEERLNQSGLKWQYQIGKRHIKILVEGHLGGILPIANGTKAESHHGRAKLNIEAQIKRIIIKLKKKE